MKELTQTDIVQTLPPEKVSLSWTTETLNIHLSKVIDALTKLIYEKDGGLRTLIDERDKTYTARHEATQLDLQHKWDSQEKAVRIAFESHDSQMHTMFDAQEKFNQQRHETQVKSCNENFEALRAALVASTEDHDQKVVAMFEAYKISKQQRWEAQEKAQDIAYKTIEKQIQTGSLEHEKQLQQRWESQERAVSAAFMAQEKLVRQAMESAQLAVSKSELSMEKRFESVNEFREQLRDQAASFINRNEFERAITNLADKVTSNSTLVLDKFDSSSKSTTERIDDLKSYKDKDSGKGEGFDQSWVILLGAMGLVSTLLSIYGIVK